MLLTYLPPFTVWCQFNRPRPILDLKTTKINPIDYLWLLASTYSDVLGYDEIRLPDRNKPSFHGNFQRNNQLSLTFILEFTSNR